MPVSDMIARLCTFIMPSRQQSAEPVPEKLANNLCLLANGFNASRAQYVAVV